MWLFYSTLQFRIYLKQRNNENLESIEMIEFLKTNGSNNYLEAI